MRSIHFWIIALAFLTVHSKPNRSQSLLIVRQDSASASPSPSTSSAPSSTSDTRSTASDFVTSTASGSTQSSASSAHSSSSGQDASSTASSSITTSRILVPSTTATGATFTSTTATPTAAPGTVLPVPPKITPAIGIAGAVLVCLGVVYTLVGIRNRWLYIFLSSMFLASLAVTVLVVYVMNPPVSDAVQGAFFVAACTTGLIFGAVSLIFTEVTEGLGCMLGGFCLSMWFLSLREGGLIQNQAGRAIFIAVMTVLAFSLSFSHYTRMYGLIVCIAFSGATIFILGVDCFSGAGLKEFWLYLWALNSDIFPLFTDTYPITRGMRAELACNVIVFILGVISQLKLWKLIKERRQKKDAERLEEAENMERLEEESGRRVEQDIARERAQWEVQYGGKSHDSGIGSSHESIAKGSISVREVERSRSDSIELADMSGSQRASNEAASRRTSKADGIQTYTVRVADEDTILEETAPGVHLGGAHDRSNPPPPKQYAQPAVVPLPFTIPLEEHEDHDDAASLTTVPESVLTNHKSVKRASAAAALKRLSIVGHERVQSEESQERLIVPHIEDDRESSVAATLDGDDDDKISLPPLSPPSSPLPPGLDEGVGNIDGVASEQEGAVDADSEALEAGTDSTREPQTTEATTTRPSTIYRQSLTKATDPKSGETPKKRSLRRQSAKSQESGDGSGPSPSDSVIEGLVEDALEKEKPSRLMLTYRTNEWAKYLDTADKPELEEATEGTSPGIRVDTGFAEAAKAVSEELDQQRHIQQQASPISPHTVQAYAPALGRHPSAARSVPANSLYDPQQGALSRNPSSATLSTVNGAPGQLPRSSSATKFNGRNFSAPLLNQTLVESPIEEAEAQTLLLGGQDTLLNRRESIMRNKLGTTSFNNLHSIPNVGVVAPSDSASGRNVRLDEPDSDNISLASRKYLIDEENMTLAERKEHVKRQQIMQMQAQQREALKQRGRQGTWPLAEQAQNFDSHQPKRSPSGVDNQKREAMLATWRNSVRQDLNPAQPAFADERRRADMLLQRRQEQALQQYQASHAQHRDSVFDQVMRQGNMIDAHKEAMRRMQASANRHA